MWSTGDWRLTHNIPMDRCNQITALDFGPDDFQVALGCKNGAVMLFNGDENMLSVLENVHPAAVTDVFYHPNGNLLLTGYQDGKLRVWSLEAVDGEQ
jgi:WD40 repeat protein